MKFTKHFIGNGAVYLYLQNQVKNGTVPHANLVVGPDHIGKTSLITNIVYLLLCQKIDQATQLACGRCKICAMLNKDIHPNVLQVKPNAKNVITITEIRALVYSLRQSSLLPGKRLILLHQADTMTTAASNALLKILEEPGKDSIFFLSACMADSVLPTIQSRCATIELYSVSNDELRNDLPDNAEDIPFASGLPGTLKNLAKGNTKKVIEDQVHKWINVIQEPFLHKRLILAQSVWPDSIKKPKAAEQLDILESIGRDILLLQNEITENIQNTFVQNELQTIAQTLHIRVTIQSIQSITKTKIRMRQPIHLKITLTDLLLTIYR